MQIVIPMSGFGERFRKAGYTVPKPLIEIDGKPIIAHVIELFSGENDFIFICNQDHLREASYNMREILHRYCPNGKIIGIKPHKLGPVHAVLQVADHINQQQPVIVNYCDFSCYWNWANFKDFVASTQCDGAIPAYKGFHPHTLGTTNYAYMRESNGWVLDIQEKQSYTDNRMEEFASSGTYYFKSGQLLLDAFAKAKAQDLNVGGEYYVSLAYKPLLAEKYAIAVYPLQHFMQWGTPEDVAEYRNWSDTFLKLNNPAAMQQAHVGGTVIIPMAGLGQRFVQEGYRVTKPLIPVSGKPMAVQAARDLPVADRYAFILRSDMPGFKDISATLTAAFPAVLIKPVAEATDGQACTAAIGLDALIDDVETKALGPITFGACDNGMLYDSERFTTLLNDPQTDVIVWVARGHSHALRHPQMYGWVDTEGDRIRQVSVKIPLQSPATDPIVVGAFTFKQATDFYQCYERMLQRDARINNEFYLDTCINDAIALGLHCRIFEVDHFLSWGTPNDLRTFEYWQSCFHKWHGHPYRLEHDQHIPKEMLAQLSDNYKEPPIQLLETAV